MREKTRLLKLSELKLAGEMDGSLFDDPWTVDEFHQYVSDHTRQVIGTFRGRKLLGYACAAIYGRRLAVERLCVHDGHNDDPATLDLIAGLKALLPAGNRVRIEIEISLEDVNTLTLFKDAGFVAKPWSNGKYVHDKTQHIRLCYLPPPLPTA